jgi:hypothetical protein
MNLQGSITELQNAGARIYLNISQCFRENNVIKELWSAMAHDVSQQIVSLHALPSSFWNRLKKEQDGLLGTISSISPSEDVESTQNQSLKTYFQLALDYEEPTILKIYVPLIRNLRNNWMEQALDFYIMVKSHLARISRVTQAFSGDPLIIQRSNILMQNFEKEVQMPQVFPKINRLIKKAQASQPARAKKIKKKPQAILRRTHLLVKRSKTLSGRVKPLVDKVSLRRRRAHR